jgi:hypothetical protein
MSLLIERGGRIFKFLDRSFNLNAERAKRIMEFFLDRIKTQNISAGEKPLCVHFEMVPFGLPPALREVLRRFPPGSLRLELGIQTFNPKTAVLIHRSGICGEEIEILEFLRRETNAIVHADLIAGLPGEDLASFGAGFDRLWLALAKESLAPNLSAAFEIQLGILKCLPGTPMASQSQAYGMCYSPAPPYEVIETGALDAAELSRIKNFARVCETIVNRNPFPALLPSLLPPGEPVFEKFMILSGRLLEHFGRNWGIDRNELQDFIEPLAVSHISEAIQ